MSKNSLREIPGYEGKYSASRSGFIYSHIRDKYLTARVNKGYLIVALVNNNIRKHHYVHRLVMSAFHGDSNLEVNHIDGNKDNNCIKNLEYVTKQENMNHAVASGLIPRKVTDKDIDAMKNLKAFGWSNRSIAKRLGIVHYTVGKYING